MTSFDAAPERVGRASLTGRTLLVPSMHPSGAEFLAACFRAIGVPALVMETGVGLDLGREQTSGKECFPCQITLGDVLHHLQAERERLGAAFDARHYAYFLPEATGPCRFGMYNKFQRLVLDRFEELRGMPIVSITTADSYSAEGLVPARDASRFRIMIFMTMLVADVFDRILWRTRPYERRAGSVAQLHAAAVARFAREIEEGGLRTAVHDFHRAVGGLARAARELVDPALPRRPRIGIVGEIYLRSHPFSNQGLVDELELHGAEVVNATLAEWVTFISWCHVLENRRLAGRHLRRGWLAGALGAARRWLGHAVEYRYLNARRRGVYAAALRHLDIPADHAVHAIERRVREQRLFSFDIGTESVLSIGGALEYVGHGCDGIVNVYPFTCMPGTIASSVLNPVLSGLRVPYLEVPCDGTRRASRETQIRTFVWQAAQRRSTGNGASRPGGAPGAAGRE